ncbi:MAG: hypothetical protein NTV49_04655 [Kiritimatiellaeota bacterium]|nr:hypothetical protein [Kiritimatiellota bacterium]
MDTNATPYVGYTFSDDATAGVLDHPRLLSVRYPSGRVVQYRYGATGSADDLLSRLASVHDDNPAAPGTAGQQLTGYAYNGLGRIVQENYPQPGVKLDYVGDVPGVYAGFDRFGRIADQNWRTAGTNIVDRFNYGHDFNGNRTWRKNVLAAATLTPKDFAYGYDGLNQLTAANRGRLQNAPSPQLVAGSTNFQQAWSLDLAGNWAGFKSGAGVGWTLDQARSNNLVNEITNITATVGAVWVTPAYDGQGQTPVTPGPKSAKKKIQLRCRSSASPAPYSQIQALARVVNSASRQSQEIFCAVAALMSCMAGINSENTLQPSNIGTGSRLKMNSTALARPARCKK